MHKEKVETAKTALDMISQIEKILKNLGPYKPELKSLTVDYLSRQSVLKMLLSVPQGLKRKLRSIEIPAYHGYHIDEVFDESFNKLVLPWQLKNNKFVLDAKLLPASEKYFVTLKGRLSKSALEELVSVHCPEDPKRDEETDRYWIHSAITDMGILEQIYSQLSVDRVATCVKVGVERSFASSIPRNVRKWLESRARADAALEGRDRQRMFASWREYRRSRRKVGQISASDIFEIARRLLSPEVFIIFVQVDDPYRIENITPIMPTGLVPDAIGINIQTDLNFQRPAAEGNLTFRKRDFSHKIRKEFDELQGKK